MPYKGGGVDETFRSTFKVNLIFENVLGLFSKDLRKKKNYLIYLYISIDMLWLLTVILIKCNHEFLFALEKRLSTFPNIMPNFEC